jgi:hypothetical protein
MLTVKGGFKPCFYKLSDRNLNFKSSATVHLGKQNYYCRRKSAGKRFKRTPI